MPIVGTAGHVDHGKSTLVQALTGRDPDRWEEEKRRGLTIDLGFAWTEVDGREIAFVDVPGHERFIKNMLAGIEAIDLALLVVAADEGWMPQSEEHLAVLDLLDVRHGVVALTKIDRVDEPLVELAGEEITEHLGGTSLEGSPVVQVSVPEGAGLEDLRRELARSLGRLPPPEDRGRPRLWVDRSFSISGAGTVVTGTLLGGALEVGEQVTVWPGSEQSRIRGLQSHERARRRVGPGSRLALNLAGVDRDAVGRGAMVGRPGQWRPTGRFLADLRLARYVDEPLTERGAFHLHVGSGTQAVSLRLLEGREIPPGGRGAALVRLESPLPLASGDRFILREVGRRLVVGGGRVLDPRPGSPRPAGAEIEALREALKGSPDDRATALLSVRGSEWLSDLSVDSDGGTPEGSVVLDGRAFAPPRVEELHRRIVSSVRAYHEDQPLRAGFPKATLAGRLAVPLGVLEQLVERAPQLEERGGAVALVEFQSSLDPDQEERWEQARGRLAAAGLMVPGLADLALDEEVVHALVRKGELVRINEDLAYLPEQLETVIEEVDGLSEAFTVAEFRDRFGISRKYAVPLLEWLDRQGITLRDGDRRIVRRPGPVR